jgi:hypothetical protein
MTKYFTLINFQFTFLEPISKPHFRCNPQLRAATRQPLVSVAYGYASSRLTAFAPTAGAFADESAFCNGFISQFSIFRCSLIPAKCEMVNEKLMINAKYKMKNSSKGGR